MAEETRKAGLDSRQKKIQVGAGLEEAKYNVEFIDFLRRWGPTAMLVLAAVAMGFWGLQRWREHKEAKSGVAFADLDQALQPGVGGDVNPEVLVRIAEDHAGQGSVSHVARLAAAEQLRFSAMKGFRPGSLDIKTGKPSTPDDALTPEGKKEFLERAARLYQAVVSETEGDVNKATLTLTGLMGLAAVNETQGKASEAKALFEQAAALAERAKYPEYVRLAKARAESVEKYTVPVTLLPESMVMSYDRPPAPVVPVAPTPSLLSPLPDIGTSTGSPLTPGLNPMPVPSPSPATAPSPSTTPAPTPPPSPAPGNPAPADPGTAPKPAR